METQTIVETLQSEGAELVLIYGSSVLDVDDPNDIDLFAVGTDTTDRQHFQLGHFDVIRQSWSEFWDQYNCLDPVYCTEPVLTGELLLDSKEIFYPIRNELREQFPNEVAVRHNLFQGVTHLQRSLSGQATQPTESIKYLASYWLFTLWYYQGRTPAPLNQVRSKVRDTAKFEAIFEYQAENKRSSVDTDNVVDLLLDFFFSENVFVE
jgi:hypothetical protein